MSRLTAREILPDLVSLDPSAEFDSPARRGVAPHPLSACTRGFSQLEDVPSRLGGAGRDGSLDAARGITLGVVLGTLCWLLIAELVQRIVS
jgi:hypothetical protein